MSWKEVNEERYHEMLEILPPARWTQKGFLVGEPWNHRKCAISGFDDQPTFAAFIRFRGKFFENLEPMTVAEFDIFDVRQLCVP